MRRGPLRASISRGSACLALVASITWVTSTARADVSGTAQRCSAAYDKAQVLRRARQLRAARDELLVCSQSACPGAITADCGPWLREVESGMPSIVIAARDAAGLDVADVKVSIDGVVLTSRLTGAPIDVDPGSHTLTIEPEHGQRVEQTLLINMGEKNRFIPVTIRPDASPPPSQGAAPPVVPGEPRKGSFVPGIVVGGLGVVSLGVSLGLYLSAKSAVDGLRGSCAPHCNTSTVDAIRTKGLVSDVTWGIGAAALGTGVLLLILLRPSSTPSAPAQTGSLTPLLAPLPGGGIAGLTFRMPVR